MKVTFWPTFWGILGTSLEKLETSFRRLAALYVAKQNSDELSIAAREAGKTWEELVPSNGVYAVRPHAPFRASAVDDFLELSDDELELYGNAGARCGRAAAAKRDHCVR